MNMEILPALMSLRLHTRLDGQRLFIVRGVTIRKRCDFMADLYQTEGIIINRMDIGEADKFLTVFTKEFGMLKIFARSVRKIKSKLNFYLNLFSHARFGFVSGRGAWHLIDAEDLGHFDEIAKDRERSEVLGRAAGFLERFHHGEGKDIFLWQVFLSFLASLKEIVPAHLDDLETVFYAKSLFLLGYLGENEEFKRILEDTSFPLDSFPLTPELRLSLDVAIRKSMYESHL